LSNLFKDFELIITALFDLSDFYLFDTFM